MASKSTDLCVVTVGKPTLLPFYAKRFMHDVGKKINEFYAIEENLKAFEEWERLNYGDTQDTKKAQPM